MNQKITIRKSTFETNSSSTHSIHLDGTVELLDTIHPTDGNTIVLTGGQFGWDWERYNDALTKANYASIYDSGIDCELLREVIEEQTGYDVVFAVGDSYGDTNYSYIDHQSYDTLQEINNKEDLRNWLFNPRCYLYTGNDNGEAPNKFYDMPEQTYTYKLIVHIPGKDMEWELKEYPDKDGLQEIVYALLERVRYNESLDKWEHKYTSWYSEHVYYELPHKYDKMIDGNCIVFIRDDLFQQAKKLFAEDVDYEIVYSKVDELENLAENRILVPYEIVEL